MIETGDIRYRVTLFPASNTKMVRAITKFFPSQTQAHNFRDEWLRRQIQKRSLSSANATVDKVRLEKLRRGKFIALRVDKKRLRA